MDRCRSSRSPYARPFGNRVLLAPALKVPATETRQARVERYRREASLLRAEAEVFFDPTIRQQLLDLAHQYEILAMSLEMLPPK
jgi:hypothetical protein